MSKPKSTKPAKAPKTPAKVAVESNRPASVAHADSPTEQPTDVSKAPKEKSPKEGLMVFAFRLTKEESVAIHKAAGPGQASKFARTLLAAAARKDEAQVNAILKAVQTEG